MSEYSDAHSATVNFLSRFDPVYRLKETLGLAKEAEQYIERAEAEVSGIKAQVQKLVTEKRVLASEIAALKIDKDEVRVAALKRLNDAIEEKRLAAEKTWKKEELAAQTRLDDINQRTTLAQTQEREAKEKAEAARRALDEVNKALAASERERREAIAVLQG